MELSVLPFIVVIVDEMADLMMVAGKTSRARSSASPRWRARRAFTSSWRRKGPRSTSSPARSRRIFPTRISFQVTSKIDSRTILGEQGASSFLVKATCSTWRAAANLARAWSIRRRWRSRKGGRPFENQGQPDYLDAITEEEPGDATMRGACAGEHGRRGIGRSLRPRREYRPARSKMLDELYPTAPVGRL